MRFLWCVNQLPDYAKGDAAGITGYFLGAFDAVTTKAALSAIQSQGHVAGIYMAWNWSQFTGKTPQQVAQIMSARYGQLAVPGLRVQFDIEAHEPGNILAALQAWRALRPKVGTSWSMEGMQGGWMKTSPGFVQGILDCKVRLVPQMYWGADGKIEGNWAADVVLKDLESAGFPSSLINGFYDAADLPRSWDGYAFEQNRLP